MNNTFLHSKKFKVAAISAGAVIVGLGIFRAGMIVGFHEASFSYQYGEHYYQNFVGPHKGPWNELFDRRFTSGHGALGTIVKISPANIIVQDEGGIEKMVLVNATGTILKKDNVVIHAADLKLGNKVVILGAPNSSGEVEARLIRVFGTLPEDGTSATGTDQI